MKPWEESQHPSEVVPRDFWVLKLADQQCLVSNETAKVIEAALDEEAALEPPAKPFTVEYGPAISVSTGRWITFTDIEGGAVRCRLRAIWLMYQSTTATRARNRAFVRAHKAEEKAEKDWSTDD
jgi:hypothetical protein